MNLAPGHAALRQRLAEAIEDVLANTSHRSLGRLLGRAGHTITDRASNLDLWPLVDVIRLAAEADGGDALRDAAVACFTGGDADDDSGDATLVPDDLRRLVPLLGDTLALAAQMLAETASAPINRRKLRFLLDALDAQTARLRRDLSAFGDAANQGVA